MKSSSTILNTAASDQVLDPKLRILNGQNRNTTVETAATDGSIPEDPFQMAESAHFSVLVGKEKEGVELLAKAHQSFLSIGEIQPAARCAFWLGFMALLAGDGAQANGWFSRAERLLDELDCVEKGYLFLPVGYRLVHEGDGVKAFQAFAEARKIGEQFKDRDLLTLALQGQGRSLIRQGEIARGVALLDEAMVGVTAGEVSPLIAGGVYCSVLDACGEIFDLRRAQEWTSALERWCVSRPEIVPYRGHCLVRRAEILQLHGAWEEAILQAQEACERFSQSHKPEAGSAFYRLGELHRVRGEYAAAERAYREAGRWLRTAHPGMALLRLAQGRIATASSSIRRIAEEVREPGSRARVLESYVEIVLAMGDVADARAAANELEEIADRFNSPWITAMSARATGAVLLAEGDLRRALAELRRSWVLWCELDAPYEAARTRVLVASVCKKLDDCDAAKLELEMAREVFLRLGAAPDLVRLKEVSTKQKQFGDTLLTPREIQILKLVATGRTNRAIALKLAISEKTVARHISNIFNKLGISSRAAATAFAYQHELM